MDRYTKRSAAQFAVALDFATFPITASETLLQSGDVGDIGVRVTGRDGQDVTDSAVFGAPWITGTQVRWVFRAGLPAGWYDVIVQAPTSDGELLVARKVLEVLP